MKQFTDKQEELDYWTSKRETLITRGFYFSLEIIAYFLIPAIATGLLGKYFIPAKPWVLLPVGFVLSWIVFWVRYKALKKTLSRIEERITTLTSEIALNE